MTERIKVVHCIDSFGLGGTELNMVRTVERLDPTRFDLFVLAMKDRGPLRDRVISAGVQIFACDFPRLNSVAALMQAVRVVRWLRTVKPHVVHSHDRYTNLFVTPCARAAGVPFVITSRRWWTAMPRLIYGLGNRIGYRMSHRIIANSAAVARLMSEVEGLPASRIAVLPNFVDEDAFTPLSDEARRQARLSFGVPADAVVATAVAVFRPEKDLVTLIRAVALLRDRHPQLHVLLFGSGTCEAGLREAVAKEGLGGRVHFPGFFNSPPNPHHFGDLSVLCSLHEGFPNSIVEAMAAGKAVVATKVGGIPDAVDDGRTGLLVPPRASDRLAAAIDRLLVDVDLRQALGAAGLKKAREAYGARSVLDRLGVIYAEGIRPTLN